MEERKREKKMRYHKKRKKKKRKTRMLKIKESNLLDRQAEKVNEKMNGMREGKMEEEEEG